MVSKTFQGDYGAAVAPADSSSALAAWLVEAAANDGSTLTIEPGSYHWATTNGPTNGLTNATISAYGATVDALFIGNAGLVQESYAQSARIQTTTPGANSVTVIGSNDGTLIAPADATLFSVDDWIMVCGLGLQAVGGSWPPNFQWNEFRKITGIAGNVISFVEPLANTYRSTWPLVDAQPVAINIGTSTLTCATHELSEAANAIFTTSGALPTGITAGVTYFVKNLSGPNFQISATSGGAAITLSGTQSGTHYYHSNNGGELAGPATIYRMLPQFDGTQIYLGLRCTAVGTFVGGGKSLTMQDMIFTDLGPAPSAGKSIVIRNCTIGTQNEVDKCVEYLEYDGCTGTQIHCQSPIGGRMLIKNCNVTTINGTARITEINGGSFNEVIRGPVFFGHSDSIRATNAAITSTRQVVLGPDPAIFTAFANGTFTCPNLTAGGGGAVVGVWQWAIPGGTYFFAFYDGAIHDTPDVGSRVTFVITDVRQDATNTYVDTNIAGALPTPTFGGQPANVYLAEATMSQEWTSSGRMIVSVSSY